MDSSIPSTPKKKSKKILPSLKYSKSLMSLPFLSEVKKNSQKKKKKRMAASTMTIFERTPTTSTEDEAVGPIWRTRSVNDVSLSSGVISKGPRGVSSLSSTVSSSDSSSRNLTSSSIGSDPIFEEEEPGNDEEERERRK